MNTRKSQRGFINLPDGFFGALFTLAALGALALIGVVGWGAWWLVTHVRFVT